MRRFEKEMDKICKKYRLKHHLLQLLLKLDYYPELHDKIRVNEMLYNYKQEGEWDNFIKKQNKRGVIYVVPIYPKLIQKQLYVIKNQVF